MKKTTKKVTKKPKAKKMLSLKQIQDAIEATIKPHNDEAKEHNKKARIHNYNKTWRDTDRMDEMQEINDSDPVDLFEENDLDFGDLTFKEIEDFGGEGQGDHCHKVYLVTEKSTGNKAHIKFDGYYNSNDGSSYDDGFYMVEPYEKVVQDWRKVK